MRYVYSVYLYILSQVCTILYYTIPHSILYIYIPYTAPHSILYTLCYILCTIYTLYYLYNIQLYHTLILYIRLLVIRITSLYTALQGRAAQTLCQVLSGCPKLIIQLQHTSILSDLLSGGTAAGTGASGGKYSTPVVVKMLTSLNKMLEDEEVRLYYSIHIV